MAVMWALLGKGVSLGHRSLEKLGVFSVCEGEQWGQAGRKSEDVLNVWRNTCFDVEPSPRGSRQSEKSVCTFSYLQR